LGQIHTTALRVRFESVFFQRGRVLEDPVQPCQRIPELRVRWIGQGGMLGVEVLPIWQCHADNVQEHDAAQPRGCGQGFERCCTGSLYLARKAGYGWTAVSIEPERRAVLPKVDYPKVQSAPSGETGRNQRFRCQRQRGTSGEGAEDRRKSPSAHFIHTSDPAAEELSASRLTSTIIFKSCAALKGAACRVTLPARVMLFAFAFLLAVTGAQAQMNATSCSENADRVSYAANLWICVCQEGFFNATTECR